MAGGACDRKRQVLTIIDTNISKNTKIWVLLNGGKWYNYCRLNDTQRRIFIKEGGRMRLYEALQNPVDSAILTMRNHSMDNSFLLSKAADIEYHMMSKQYSAVGVSFNVPFSRYRNRQIAFVYEYMDDKYWVHMPETMWLRLMTDYFGRYPCPAIRKVLGVHSAQ